MDQPRGTLAAMRKEIYRMDRAEALTFLAAAPAVHIASTDGAGRPVFRTVNAVVEGGALAFHGAPAGEKMETIGREAVIAAEETIASIPSYFVDPERACPATTYFRSVQVHGPIERVDDEDRKARVLQAMMAKYQPEGGHVPIDAEHPLYRKAVAGVMVLKVDLERVDGKSKLGQNRGPEELRVILERLWRRGGPGDVRAIDLVRAANAGRDLPIPSAGSRASRARKTLATPDFLAAPDGATLLCAPGPREAEDAAALLASAYWNVGLSRERIARAHAGSNAWVAARDDEGRLIGTARAISDGAKRAWVYDVMVADAWRGRGLGRALMRLLVDHPTVRGARFVWLTTRDRQRFYEGLGFTPMRALPAPPFQRTEMMLDRGPANGEG